MTDLAEFSEDFEFEAGDTVLVRIREDGSLVAKFIAECVGFRKMDGPRSDMASFEVPWDRIGYVSLRSYQAEFERFESADEVSF